MGIKGWVNLDGRRKEETGIVSNKDNDVLKLLLALLSLHKPCRGFVLIFSYTKFSKCFLENGRAQVKTILFLISNYTETPYFSAILSKQEQTVNVIDFSQFF